MSLGSIINFIHVATLNLSIAWFDCYRILLSLILFIQVEQEWNRGNHEGAKAASRQAKIWFIVSLVAGIVSYVVLFTIIIIANVATAAAASSANDDY